MISYFNRIQNKEMSYFNVVGAEGSTVVHQRVYLKNKYNTITEGMSFKFKNIIQKSDNEYWVTGSSIVAFSSVVETDPDLQVPLLPEERPPQGETKTIASAIRSPEKSSVSGKIVKVSPVKYRQEGTLAVRAIVFKDQQTLAKFCLFGRNAESAYNVGDMLKVTAVYPKKYNNKLQLTSSPVSVCEFIADVPELQIEPGDEHVVDDDPDFNSDTEEGERHDITLTEFTDLEVYDCCEVEACRRKKMIHGSCPVCGSKQTSLQTFRIHFLYRTEGKTDQRVTLFQSSLEKIMNDVISFEDKDDLIRIVIGKLPITFKAAISSGNYFYNIIV